MAKQTKRIVSTLLSVLLIATSISVAFVASAEEAAAFAMPSMGENVAVMKGDTQIGTVNHFNSASKPAEELLFLEAQAAEGSEKLNTSFPVTAIHTNNGDGTYSEKVSGSSDKLAINGVNANGGYKCENGTQYNADYATLYSCSNKATHSAECDGSCSKSADVAVKQHGWDKDGYYYYDYYDVDGQGTESPYGTNTPVWSSVKHRDQSVTAPHEYETYTFTFPRNSTITDFNFATAADTALRTSYYEVYATTGKLKDLYNEENKLFVYNGDGVEGGYAFASHYNFGEGFTATYVGVKILDAVSMPNTGRIGPYYIATRAWVMNFYGIPGAEKCTIKTGALSAVKQTADSEDNYSIPAKIYETDNKYQPAHIYYRNNLPFEAGSSNTDDGRLWNDKTDQDVQFDGRETYKSGSDLIYYDGVHTELFYDFGDIYEIGEIIYANHNNEKLRASDMTVYASNDFTTLFTPENELACIESNVAAFSIVPKEKLEARYVGIYFGDLAWDNAAYPGNDYIRATEFNVIGKATGKKGQVATVTNFSSYTDASAAVANKNSVVVQNPTVYGMLNGTKIETKPSADKLARLYDGSLSHSAVELYEVTHKDADRNYLQGANTYTAVKYDLRVSRKISDVFFGNHDNAMRQTGFYKVYVSEDETIDETDLVAQVSTLGRSAYFNRHANLITLPEGTTGRYVEVRIYIPVKQIAANTNVDIAYAQIKEINVYGDMGYTLKGETYSTREIYFTKNAENIANSLIAMAPIYKIENVTSVNYGNRDTNTSKYKGMLYYGTEDWDELSRSFTETTYYDVDGDLGGVNYTREVFACGGINGHAEGCPADETCTGKVEAIDDGSVYQTVIYKLNAKSTITEVDIYHSTNDDRLTSHYLISFADKEEDLFTDAATTIDVANYIRYRYNLVKLNQPVTAKFFAVKLICGVQPGVINDNRYNYGRMGHFTLVGESLACGDDAHVWEEAIIAAPDCVNAGSKCNVCTVCGAETAAEEIPALGHTEVKIEAKPATCTEAGWTEGKWCSVCGETYEGKTEIPATGHQEAAAVVENENKADCINGGSYDSVVYCSVCNIELSRTTETTEALGHTPETVDGKAPTCTEPGLTTGSKCSVCGEVLTAQDPIKELGHTEETVKGYPATCTTKGLTDGIKCSVCGVTIKAQEEIAELGHTEETVKGYPATCTTKGLTDGVKCSVCGEILTAQEEIKELGHTEETVKGYAATCTTKGLTDGVKCSVCGETIKAQEEIKELGHDDYGCEIVYETIKKATCTEDGSYLEIYHCVVCGEETYREEMVEDAIDHNFDAMNDEDTYSETCEKDGQLVFDCVNGCGEKEVNVIPAKGHNMQINAEGTAKVCANGCGKQIALYTVTFVGKDDALLHKVVVEDGGVLTAEDIAAAEAAVPYIKGYKNNGWNVDFSADMVVEANMTIKALYERETETYETKVEDSTGNVLDTEAIQFDQRFTIKDAGATAFLVNGQVVGGAGAVSLYGCGALTIVASTDATIDTSKISVAILKTETDVVNGANVLRVYTNIYNPASAVVEKTGVIITAGSIYDAKGKFEIDTLADNEKILVEAKVNANQMLATLGGISTTVSNLRRVSRAYAVIGGEYYYSSFIAVDTFNK